MASTFLGIELGKRSLIAHQTGLHVIGQNLSNADNKTYSRQRAILTAVEPLYDPAFNRAERKGQIGQGVNIEAIRRERDIYLDVRIAGETSRRSFWETNQMNLRQIEDIHHALEDQNLQESIDVFWKSWQELSKNPSEPAVKQELVERSKAMGRQVRQTFRRLDAMQHELNEKIRSDVSRINLLSQAIADLNTKILQSQALGDNPNDLMDKRDGFIVALSEMVPVESSFNDQDEIMVFIGGKVLIQGTQVNPLRLEANPNNKGFFDIYWENTGDALAVKTGSLQAKLLGRDTHLHTQITRLDTLSLNLMTAINAIHQKGFNTYGKLGGVFLKRSF